MPDKSMNFAKKRLTDSDILPHFFSDTGGKSCILLTLIVKNYSQLKRNVIYYASEKIDHYRWTYKLAIANGTLFVFMSNNANLEKPMTFVHKTNGSFLRNYHVTPYKSLIISEFCQKAIMNRKNEYLHSGSLIIEFNCEIEGYENNKCTQKNLRDATEYCRVSDNLYFPLPDVKIQVESETMFIHRTVLIAYSKQFAKIFSNIQPSPNKVTCIAIHENPRILINVLDYMKSGELCYLDNESMIEVYRIANILEIDLLERRCMDYFKDNLSPSNEMRILVAATMYGLVDLKNAAARYMARRGKKFLHSSKILDIMRAHSMEK